MAHFALQFGKTEPHKRYAERPSVYGVCARADGKIALARIGTKPNYQYDLPGGGIEQGESEPEALIREYEEETGLGVWPVKPIGRAGQFWIDRDEPRNSLAAFYEVEITSDDGQPTEPDHSLVWMAPFEAALAMRHDSHAWAILYWARTTRR